MSEQEPLSWNGFGAVFWSNGRAEIYRHCDGVFELRSGGVQVMPIGSFEAINRYLWLEFDIL